MAWVILIGSGVLEAVWATALGASQGFRRPVPTVVFLVAMVISVYGLSLSMREIPVGTAYAVWTAVGACLTVLVAIATGAERATATRLVLLAGVVGCVIGLKAVS